MLKTLAGIVKDNWDWRSQIAHLAMFDMRKKSRGAVLSWAWFFVRPAIYIVCFWFALKIGLRADRGTEGMPPYILWLTAGIIPWFFMQERISRGSDVLHQYSYLVNKVKFPISAISTISTTAGMIVHLILLAALFAIYLVCGQMPDIYLLQVPLILLLMFAFWDMFSILFSQLSAFSKDVANLIKAFSTPLFWLSGVIFNVKSIDIGWLQTALDFNPVTFFVNAYRCAFYDRTWFWDDAGSIAGFAVVFAATLVVMLLVYKAFNEEVADVL